MLNFFGTSVSIAGLVAGGFATVLAVICLSLVAINVAYPPAT